jgi:hypothetical protein
MKYVLILSFLYKRYKENNGQLSLNLNDRLIDNILLNEDIVLKDVLYECNISGTAQSWRDSTPSKFYYYEIDGKDIIDDNVNKLKLDIENDFNNYTNGFMTESSYLSFVDIMFLPKKFFDVEIISRLEKSNMKKFWDRILPAPGPDCARHKKRKEFQTTHGRWPGVNWPLSYRTKKDVVKQANVCDNIGGSFSLELPISKKHGIHMIRQKEFIGPPCSVGESYIYNAIGHTQINNEKGPWINITVDKKNED